MTTPAEVLQQFSATLQTAQDIIAEQQRVILQQAARIRELEWQRDIRGIERRERSIRRCEVAAGIIAAKQLPAATLADWEQIHFEIQVEEAEALWRYRPPPPDLKIEPVLLKRNLLRRGRRSERVDLALEYYVQPRSLMIEYLGWRNDQKAAQ